MAMLNGSKGAVSQINVTPLIDVLLVLLIIFMVIVPKAPSGMPAMTPQPSKATTHDAGDSIVVQVQVDHAGALSYRVNSAELAKSELGPKLAAIFAMRQDKVMFVKGDPKLTYEDVAEVVDLGRHAGAVKVAMLTPGSETAR